MKIRRLVSADVGAYLQLQQDVFSETPNFMTAKTDVSGTLQDLASGGVEPPRAHQDFDREI